MASELGCRLSLRGAGRASLRLSVAGAAYVRRAAPLITLSGVSTSTGIGVASVRLRIGRHRGQNELAAVAAS